MEQTLKQPKLTKKQRGFVRDYLESGNATAAAKNNYDVSNDLTARVIGSENLTKPNVIAYLESKAEKAAEFIFQLAESAETESVRLNASKDILDRAVGKVPEIPPEAKTNITYNFIQNTAIQADIRKLEDEIKRKLLNDTEI